MRLAVLLLAGCAGAPERTPTPPTTSNGPTAEDREVAQLLSTVRKGEERWHAQAAEQRRLRERVLAVSSASGLALARKELVGLANRSLLQVLRQVDGEPGGGATYIRSHPVSLEIAGNPRALVNFLLEVERRAPRFRLGEMSLQRQRTNGSAGFEAKVAIDVLERVAVPPPLLPPPVTPPVPLEHAAAVKTLRSHILRLDKALKAGAERNDQLRAAAEEVEGGSPVLSGPVAALFPKGAHVTVLTASWGGGQFAATANAPTEEAGRLWAEAVDRHAWTIPGVVVGLELSQDASGGWVQVIDLAGSTATPSSDAPRTSR